MSNNEVACKEDSSADAPLPVMAEVVKSQDAAVNLDQSVVYSTPDANDTSPIDTLSAAGNSTSDEVEVRPQDVKLSDPIEDVTTLDYPTNGATTNDDGTTSDDKPAIAPESEDTQSEPAAVEGDFTKTDSDKPTVKAQAPKKAAPLKPMQLNKEFLTSGTAPVARGPQPQKLSLSTTKGPKAASAPPISPAILAGPPKPRLISKMAHTISRPSALGTISSRPGDIQPVWNKNQPVVPVTTKDLTDEELSKNYGIHIGKRLEQSEETNKEPKWADIDDEEEDWQPDIPKEWADGTKVEVSKLEKGIDGSQDSHTPVESKRPSVFGGGSGDQRFGATSLKRSEEVSGKPSEASASKGSPWAPVPAGEFPTPRPVTEPPSSAMGMFGRPNDARASMSPLKPTVATDDFSRGNQSWRDKGQPTLFNSSTGKMDPVDDSNRRKGSRPEPSRPHILQKPHPSATGHPEPSAAFQQTRNAYPSGGGGRRRASSSLSIGSAAGRRASLTSGFSGPNDAREHGPLSPEMMSPHSRGLVPYPHSGGASSDFISEAKPEPVAAPEPAQPAYDPMEATRLAVIEQGRIMKESRELARQRRLDEENALEAARHERIRQKLLAMGDAGLSNKKASQTPVPSQGDAIITSPATTYIAATPTLNDDSKDVAQPKGTQELAQEPATFVEQAVVSPPAVAPSSIVSTAKSTSSVNKEFTPEPWKASPNRGQWAGAAAAPTNNNNIWGPPSGDSQQRYAQNPLPFSGNGPATSSANMTSSSGMPLSNGIDKLSPGNPAPGAQNGEVSNTMSPYRAGLQNHQAPPGSSNLDASARSSAAQYNQGQAGSQRNGARQSNSRQSQFGVSPPLANKNVYPYDPSSAAPVENLDPRNPIEPTQSQNGFNGADRLVRSQAMPNGVEQSHKYDTWKPLAPSEQQRYTRKDEFKSRNLVNNRPPPRSNVAGNQYSGFMEQQQANAEAEKTRSKADNYLANQTKEADFFAAMGIHHPGASEEKIAVLNSTEPVSAVPVVHMHTSSRVDEHGVRQKFTVMVDKGVKLTTEDVPVEHSLAPLPPLTDAAPSKAIADSATSTQPVVFTSRTGDATVPPTHSNQMPLGTVRQYHGPPNVLHAMQQGGVSKFFPSGTEPQFLRPSHNGGLPYPSRSDSHITTTLFAQSQPYPVQGQPTSTVVSIPQHPRQQIGHGMGRSMHAPQQPMAQTQLPFKQANGRGPPSSSQADFDKTLDKIRHSRDNSADLSSLTVDTPDFAGTLELNATSKPVLEEYSGTQVVKVSLPGVKKPVPVVAPLEKQEPEPLDVQSLPETDAVMRELHPQGFGSRPVVKMPTQVSAFIQEHGFAKVPDCADLKSKSKKPNKQKQKAETIQTVEVYTGPDLIMKSGKLPPTITVKSGEMEPRQIPTKARSNNQRGGSNSQRSRSNGGFNGPRTNSNGNSNSNGFNGRPSQGSSNSTGGPLPSPQQQPPPPVSFGVSPSSNSQSQQMNHGGTVQGPFPSGSNPSMNNAGPLPSPGQYPNGAQGPSPSYMGYGSNSRGGQRSSMGSNRSRFSSSHNTGIQRNTGPQPPRPMANPI